MKLFDSFNIGLISIILILSFWIIYPNHLPIYFETHYLISELNNQNIHSDKINLFYLFLKTPIYFILSDIFDSPKLFFLFSIFSELILSILIYIIVYAFTKNALASILSFLLFSPLFNAVCNSILGVNFFQGFSSGIGWGSVIFSVRYLIGILYLITIYCYLKNKYIYGVFFASFSLLVHPNSGIYLVSLIIAFEVLFFLINRKDVLKIIISILFPLIFLIPTLIKIYNLGSLETEYQISNSDWYFNMVRDEVDDFSVLYRLLYSPFTFIFHSLFVFFTVFSYFKFIKNITYFELFLLNLALLPVIGAIIFIIIEITLPITNFFLAPILIGMQPGHKILSFSVFPLIFLWSKYFTIFLSKYWNFTKLTLTFFSVIFFLVTVYSIKISSDQRYYFNGLSNIKNDKKLYSNALLNFTIFKGNSNPIVPKIYEADLNEKKYSSVFGRKTLLELYILNKKNSKKVNSSFNKKYQDPEIYKDLINMIIQNLNTGEGIIIPPYLFHIRDSLPLYKIFFQEHHDGNVAMGSKIIYGEIEKRMELLIGTNYLNIPPQKSKMNYSYMRELFLLRNEDNFRNILLEYPDYGYLITESKHHLNFEVIDRNNHFILYKLNKK